MGAFIPRSIAHRTDLIFARFESEIEQYESGGQPYLCIRTPRRPDYFWGNTLLFSRPPQSGDFTHWQKLYRQHFPDADFMTFSWDQAPDEIPEIQSFLAAGFKDDCCSVLQIQAEQMPLVRPPKWNSELITRPLQSDADWQQVVEVHMNGHWHLNPEHELGFVTGQMQVAREMVEAGLGLRFGAFMGSQLVGDMGLYWTEDNIDGQSERLGRFHNVATHRDYFRQGVCSTLMTAVVNYAFHELKLDKLVIVADADDFPQHIYRGVGFRHCEWQPGLEWHDPERYG